MRPNISVIICAYTLNRWQELGDALASVKRQFLLPLEVIVVVDHNRELLDMVRANHPDVIAIKNSQQKGLSGARNSGIAIATGEVLAFMDEDAIASPNWLKTLQAGYQDPSVQGVGGSILPRWEHRRPEWFPAEFDWVVGCTYKGMPESPDRVRNLIGCNMSFRRTVFDKVGGFRNGMGRLGVVPLGCEETELCIRINQAFQAPVLLFDPNARVYHRVPEVRTSMRYFYSRCYSEGISKSQVAQWVGAGSGLSNERVYTPKILPRAVRDGLTDLLIKAKPAGIGRSWAILSGLAVTIAGYITGMARIYRNHPFGYRESEPQRNPGNIKIESPIPITGAQKIMSSHSSDLQNEGHNALPMGSDRYSSEGLRKD